jgi:hypothetical protein
MQHDSSAQGRARPDPPRPPDEAHAPARPVPDPVRPGANGDDYDYEAQWSRIDWEGLRRELEYRRATGHYPEGWGDGCADEAETGSLRCVTFADAIGELGIARAQQLLGHGLQRRDKDTGSIWWTEDDYRAIAGLDSDEDFGGAP